VRLVSGRPGVIEFRACASSLRDPLPFAPGKVGSVPLAGDFNRKWMDGENLGSVLQNAPLRFYFDRNSSGTRSSEQRYVAFYT
jgi:hypothetical protein